MSINFLPKTKNATKGVPSLVNLCINSLIQCVDAIRDIGDLPFELIEPVLWKCKPEQLFEIENSSPEIQRHTNDIWKNLTMERFPHVLRTISASSMEKQSQCWRDIYNDSTRQEEERFSAFASTNRTKSAEKLTKTLEISQIPKKKRKKSSPSDYASKRFKSAALQQLLK